MGKKNVLDFIKRLSKSYIITIFFILCGCALNENHSEITEDIYDTFIVGGDSQSSNEIKDSILNSYFIRTLKIINPKKNGGHVSEVANLQDLMLNEDQTKEIEILYNELLIHVIKYHKQKYGTKTIRPRLQIRNSDDWFSGVTEDNTIIIDTKMVLSAFVGVVGEDEDSDEDDLTDYEIDLPFNQKVRREILDVQSAVEFLESQPTYDAEQDALLFDAAENPAEIFLTHPIAQMRIAETAFSFSIKRYEATVLFILAHEYGHIMLDHASRVKSRISQKDYCKKRYGVEIEADVYAANLLSPHMELNNNRLFDHMLIFSGDSIFFDYVYHLAGYDEGTIKAQCSRPYPSIETRRKFSSGKYKIDWKSNNEELWSDINSNYLEQIH